LTDLNAGCVRFSGIPGASVIDWVAAISAEETFPGYCKGAIVKGNQESEKGKAAEKPFCQEGEFAFVLGMDLVMMH
jgi:hypothetical protein